MPPKLLTPKQVSERLSIPEKTLANWRSNGLQKALAWFKFGGHVRYCPEALDAYIERSRAV